MFSFKKLNARGNPPDAQEDRVAIQKCNELMILRLIFLVLLLQRDVQASQPIPINVINFEAQVMSQLQSKGAL